MEEIRLRAYAKINLTLDVKYKRPDGYHEVEMVMQTVSLHDSICLKRMETGGIFAKSNRFYVPRDERNTAVAAAQAFFSAVGLKSPGGLEIHIKKEIPVAAGLAGGSADAAAVLRGLNRMFHTGLSAGELMKIGAAVGSDVPFCLMGGTALAFGRGERLIPLCSPPDFHVVLCKPPFSLSTAKMYGQLDWSRLTDRPDTEGMKAALAAGSGGQASRYVKNVMEQALGNKRPAIDGIKRVMCENGALAASMSGSGPSVFGLFSDVCGAETAARALKKQYRDVFLCAIQRKID